MTNQPQFSRSSAVTPSFFFLFSFIPSCRPPFIPVSALPFLPRIRSLFRASPFSSGRAAPCEPQIMRPPKRMIESAFGARRTGSDTAPCAHPKPIVAAFAQFALVCP